MGWVSPPSANPGSVHYNPYPPNFLPPVHVAPTGMSGLSTAGKGVVFGAALVASLANPIVMGAGGVAAGLGYVSSSEGKEVHHAIKYGLITYGVAAFVLAAGITWLADTVVDAVESAPEPAPAIPPPPVQGVSQGAPGMIGTQQTYNAPAQSGMVGTSVSGWWL